MADKMKHVFRSITCLSLMVLVLKTLKKLFSNLKNDQKCSSKMIY